MAKLRVVIVDDHPMVRQGLCTFLTSAQLEVVATCATGEEGLVAVQENHVDVMLLDMKLSGLCDGLCVLERLRNMESRVKVLVLSSYDDASLMGAALHAGAYGFLNKSVEPDDLLSAIIQVGKGRSVMDQEAREAMQEAGLRAECLTLREKEVLGGMTKGLSNKEIATALGITEKTVKVHVSHILGKLGVLDRTQAVILAFKQGLVGHQGKGW